jgi:hypothetical protein
MRSETNLHRRIVSAAAVAIAALAVMAASAAEKTEVKPCGLRVVAEAYEGESEMRPFYQDNGTTVVLEVVRPEGGLIAFDENASKLVSFTDDKDTRLLTRTGFGRSGFGMMTKISSDGKAALIEINGNELPAKEAREIRISGTLVFTAATKTKAYQQADVPVKEGTQINAGPIPLKITGTGKPEWGDEPLQITLEARQDLQGLASIRFLDSDGKEIEAADAGRSRMSFGNQVQEERSYNLKRKVDKVTVEVTYWTDKQELKVPMEVVARLGL